MKNQVWKNPFFCQNVNLKCQKHPFHNVMSGKLDGYDDCKVIVEKIKEYSGRVDVTIPDDVQTAVIRSSQENVLKECKKLAKEALKEAKNEMKTWGR